MLSWDPGLDMCPKFPPRPSGIRWWPIHCSALSLLQRIAEGKGCLQTETCPLDSGGYSLTLSGPAVSVPVGSDSSSGDPTCVFFHGTTPLTVSPCLSLAETFCYLCCVVTSPQPGWVYLRDFICSTALGQSICVISTWYLLYAECGFRSISYSEYTFPVLPTVQNSISASLMHLCLSPVLSSVPTGVGRLAGFCRLFSNSGIFIGIPFTSVTWRYVERDWLKGNILVTYVTLVPWRTDLKYLNKKNIKNMN